MTTSTPQAATKPVLATPADPDAHLKEELREIWVDAHPDYVAALDALAAAEAAAKSPSFDPNPLAFVNGTRVARAAAEAARANVIAVRASLGATFDQAVRLSPVVVDVADPTASGVANGS
jgi:hypothetical protein